MGAEKGADEGVAAVNKALMLLSMFRGDDACVTLAELAKRTGLYKSTILRLMSSLERFGFIRRLSSGSYQIGPQISRLSAIYKSQFNTRDHVLPVLAQISDELGESASFYVRDRDVRVCLHRSEARRAVRDEIREGDVLPLNIGAAGHVLLAFGGEKGPRYDAIRASWFSASFGERDPETAAMAVPVFGIHAEIKGTLVISGPRFRLDQLDQGVISQRLFDYALQLTEIFGGPTEGFANRADESSAKGE